MPYVPKTWVDGPAGGTPILASDLNHLEQGVKAASPVYNVKDPAFGAVGNAVTDDTAAIQAAITAAYSNGIVLIPAGQYIISAPLEVLGAVQFEGGDSRISVLIASSSFSGNQMIRNWVAADWQAGETDHRVAPSNPTFSGTHTASNYVRIRNLGFNAGGKTNLACVSWAGPQETSLLKNLVVASGSSSTSNLGIWGIDIQGTTVGIKCEDIVFYGTGWERQMSFDSSASSGEYVFCDDITFSPSKLWHSRCYVNNVDNFTLHGFHMETAGSFDAAAKAYIYLVSHTGFGSYSIRDGSMWLNASTSKPFLLQDNDQTGNMTRITAPVVDRLKMVKTAGTWTGNLIVDQYNSVPLNGAIGGQSAASLEVIDRYDGSSLVWTNTDGTRGVHYYKNPDGLVTALNVKDYGAVGDGATDDTAAIQAALDAAQAIQATVFLPSPPGSGYVVSNLKMAAQTRLIGSGMSSCTLQQKTGATGTVLREKTVAEGNAGGAAGIWVTDLKIIGNTVAGNGLDLGNQTGGQLNLNAGVERIFVQNFSAGTGITINGNAIRCAYMWSNSNSTGISTSGGANSWVGLWAEANTVEDIHIGTSGDSYFHLQSESVGGTSIPINISANDNVLVRPYISISANATHIIKCSTGSNRNHIIGAYLATNSHTFSNLIYSEVITLGTGSSEFHIPEWFDRAPVQKARQGEADATYSSSITVDLNISDKHYIPVTNTTAFTINAPLSPIKGYRLMLNIKNNSGGVMGVITWNAVFKLAGAFTNPASTKQRNIEFYYDGGNWVETNRAAADI